LEFLKKSMTKRSFTRKELPKMSPTELAKKAGVRPQAIYNLIKMGYIKAEMREVVITRWDIPEDVANRYLAKRKLRQEGITS